MEMLAPNNSFSFNTNRIRFNRTLRALKRVWKTDRHREKERFVLHVFLLPVSNVVESALLRLVSAFQPVSHLQMAFSCNIFFCIRRKFILFLRLLCNTLFLVCHFCHSSTHV